MNITGTHINYYLICHRKLWLFANGIQMEHNSELVSEGKLIHETTYPDRAEKYTEIEFNGIKIDFYDPKQKIIHEVKKGKAFEKAHEWQVKYYMYILEQEGIEGVTAILEYPKLKKTSNVILTGKDREEIRNMLDNIEKIINQSDVPAKINRKYCKNCSYLDFCYSGEE